MDETMTKEKVRVTDLARMKAERTPIAILTAYDFPFAHRVVLEYSASSK
jgi:hypothetical protein